MSFEDIPEDKIELYPCHICGGNVELTPSEEYWECDECDWTAKVSND